MASGDWVKTDTRTINCDNDETPERQKVLDREPLSKRKFLANPLKNRQQLD